MSSWGQKWLQMARNYNFRPEFENPIKGVESWDQNHSMLKIIANLATSSDFVYLLMLIFYGLNKIPHTPLWPSG